MNLSRWGISALGIAVGVAGVTTAGAQSVQLERSGNSFHAAVCARGNPAGTARCFAHVVTDARGNPHNGKLNPAATPSGYGPAQLQSAYNIPAGTGAPTVAIVDAFGYPNAEADLAVYRAQCGLPELQDPARPGELGDLLQPLDGRRLREDPGREGDLEQLRQHGFVVLF